MPKRNVALFKSPVDSGEEDKYCQYLTSRGHTVHLVPVIQFDFINEEALKLAVEDGKYFGIIFTSVRSVDAVARTSLGNIDHLTDKKMFVVGESTKSAVKTKLGQESCGEECGSGEQLCKYIPQHIQDKRDFLFPASSLAKNTIQEELEKYGHKITRIDSYDTSENQNLQTAIQNIDQDVDVLAFFSPSGVEAAFKYLTDQQKQSCQFVAIGETTRNSILQYTDNAQSADKPNPESLAVAIENLKCPL